MSAPRISVVLPVHNGERYLVPALDSVLQQTFDDFEVIAIDDGSSDATLSILQRYEAADPRVVVVSRARKGLIDTLNEGIQIARGEFVARMDADDIALPERFERQLRYLKDNPECVAVGCAAQIINSEGAVIGEFSIETDHEAIDRCNMLNINIGIPHPTAMIRRESLLEVDGYRKEFPVAEDLDLFLRLAERGRLANLPEILFSYRMHGDNVSLARRTRQTESAEAAILEAYRRRRRPIPPQLRRQLAKIALQAGRVRAARSWALSAAWHDPRNFAAWQLLAVTLFPVPTPGGLPKWLDPVRLCRSLGRRCIFSFGYLVSRKRTGRDAPAHGGTR